MRFVTTSMLLFSATLFGCGQLVGTPHSASSLVPSIGSALARPALGQATDLAADPKPNGSEEVLHIRGVEWGRRADVHDVDAMTGGARVQTSDPYVRISRLHSRWIAVESADPSDFLPPVLDPRRLERTVLTFRGATSAGPAVVADANALDAFGDPRNPSDSVVFWNNDSSWKSSMTELYGAHFVQMQATIVSDAVTARMPSNSGLGVAFTRN